MMAAESGYAAAQFNVAFLCEQNSVSYTTVNLEFSVVSWSCYWSIHSTLILGNYFYSECQKGSFLDPAFASHCMWRYYNLTIQSQNPDTYGKYMAFET